MMMEKTNFELKPKLSAPKIENKTTPFLAAENILELSPREMVDYLTSLQVQGKLTEFLEKAVENEALLAQFSYWEKWLEKDQQILLENIIKKKREIYPLNSESLPLELEKRFSEDELELIFSNLRSIQLTYGCSKGCPFCGFDAVKKVREHLPYSQLVNLFKKYGSQISKGKPTLYWASEPSDYASKEGLEDKTYQDVHELAVNYAGYDPGVTSSNVNDQKWIEFMNKKIDLKAPHNHSRRFSVFGLSYSQLTQVRVKMFTAASKMNKKYGEHQEIQFPGWIHSGKNGIAHHLKGMGKSFEQQTVDDDILKASIACVDGVLLTPRGLFNVFVVPISKEYPQGTMVIPLEQVADKPIKKGDRLKEVMRRSVVAANYFDEAGLFRDKEGNLENFQRYIGKFPRKVTIYCKNKKYHASVDQGGNITQVDEF